nr:BEL1-like homeodomain protein 4 [Tanacetum cinerariifolium]
WIIVPDRIRVYSSVSGTAESMMIVQRAILFGEYDQGTESAGSKLLQRANSSTCKVLLRMGPLKAPTLNTDTPASRLEPAAGKENAYILYHKPSRNTSHDDNDMEVARFEEEEHHKNKFASKSMSQDYIFNFSHGFERASQDQQHHMANQIRRDKLRVQGFEPPPGSLVGLEDGVVGGGEIPAVYETGAGMLSEMFNYQTGTSATELLENQINYQQHRSQRGENWYGNSAQAMQLFLMNPSHESPSSQSSSHHHHNPSTSSSTLHMLLPNNVTSSSPTTLHHQQSFGSTSGSGQGQFGPSTQFAWVPPSGGSGGSDPYRNFQLQGVGGGGVLGPTHHPIHVGYGSSSLGAVKALRTSRYVKAAQELLEEFCSVGRGQFKMNKSGSKHNTNQNPSNSSGGGSSASKDLPPLSSAERIEHQRGKSKLLSMLDEASQFLSLDKDSTKVEELRIGDDPTTAMLYFNQGGSGGSDPYRNFQLQGVGGGVATGRYVVPTGRVIVATGRIVSPGSDNDSDDVSIHNEATNTQQQQPNLQPQIITTVSNNNAEFPYLKKDETERDHDGRVIILPPMTAEEHIAVQRESKARTTLLQSIPDDHMRKSMLKQEFSKFRIGEAEGLYKGYDRMQKILSQLNQLKAKPDAEDINLKFLRALPLSWSQMSKDTLLFPQANLQDQAILHLSGNVVEEDAAKIYNLITGADTEEASSADDAGEFALMGITSERVFQRNQLTLEDKIRVMSIELENTSNLLKHSERINVDFETAKKDLQTKLDNHLVQTENWRNSSKNLFKLIDSSMFVRTKVGLGFTNCIIENELGWDDFAFSVFTTNSEDMKGRPIFHRFAKTDSMKAVPPPLTGDYTSLSDHIDLNESQMSYSTKSSTSSDSKTSNIHIPPVRPQSVPTGKPKVTPVPIGKPKVTPVPAGRKNRPFQVPTDRGYSPSVVDFPRTLFKNKSSRYVVPTGRVIVPTGRYVVPTGRVIVAIDRIVGPGIARDQSKCHLGFHHYKRKPRLKKMDQFEKQYFS